MKRLQNQNRLLEQILFEDDGPSSATPQLPLRARHQQPIPRTRTPEDWQPTQPPLPTSNDLFDAFVATLETNANVMEQAVFRMREKPPREQLGIHKRLIESMVNVYIQLATAGSSPRLKTMASSVATHLGQAYKALAIKQ